MISLSRQEQLSFIFIPQKLQETVESLVIFLFLYFQTQVMVLGVVFFFFSILGQNTLKLARFYHD